MFVVCISTLKKKNKKKLCKKNFVTHSTKNNPANDVLFKLYKFDSQYDKPKHIFKNKTNI